MRIEKDFKKFIELLNKNKVRYLIVGRLQDIADVDKLNKI